MKKGIAIILASASATALAVPAAAQDNSAFTGPRIEGIAGYDISKAGSDVDNDLNDEDDESIDGFMYGVGIGYDVAVGGLVLGAEAELTDSTAKTEVVDGDLEDLGIAGEFETGRDIYVGARAGVLANPNTLLYVKGGYTNARFSAESGALRAKQDLDGYRIGGGAQFALAGKAYIGGEYRFSDYEDDVRRHQLVATIGTRF